MEKCSESNRRLMLMGSRAMITTDLFIRQIL